MFRAFIIDDDIFAVDAVYMMFPWEELNVSQIEKIYSTQNIVERIVTEKPHIVFIDIEIYDVSGLDIIRKCREQHSESLFIIISGHDNFKYAREAVNLNVLYYLLKPLDAADIVTVTKKLKNALSQQLLSENLTPVASGTAFSNWLAQYLEADETYRLILGEMTAEERVGFENFLGSSLCACQQIGSKRYVFVVAENLLPADKHLLFDFVSQNSLVLGASNAFKGNNQIAEHFRQATLLSYSYFIYQKYEIAFPNTINQGKIRQIIDKLLTFLEEQNVNEIKSILSALPELFVTERYTIEQAALVYNTIIGRINLIYTDLGHSTTLAQMNEDDLFIYFQTFQNLCNALWDYFCVSLDTDSPDAEHESVKDSQNLWLDISRFIEDNYVEKLRVQDICNHFFISQRSFFKVFKSNTTETFVEYLTRIRIEKSKELLLNTQKTLPEIADAVGIGDYYYFNKIFKKVTGTTPLKFRKQGGTIHV